MSPHGGRVPSAAFRMPGIIGNQAFQNGRCHICFSLDLGKLETGYNLLMEQNALTKYLIVHIQTVGLLVGAASLLIFK